jgi:toxin ParE1/3/4
VTIEYSIFIEPLAVQDIQNAIDFYDEKQIGLGEKFEAALNHHLLSLEKNPFYQVRYDEVHCLPIKKFPYMIHYTVDRQNRIVIRGLLRNSAFSGIVRRISLKKVSPKRDTMRVGLKKRWGER